MASTPDLPAPSAPCVSFLTDYGLEDGFTAACHGVIAGLAPGVRVIDVTHLVAPGDVRRGAAVLAQTVPYLPAGSVHLAVVDPGVGTARRGIAVEAAPPAPGLPPARLVGPDNGLLPDAAEALGGIAAVHELTARELMVHPVSRTFHGRDVFAPVAARLAAGLPLDAVGPRVDPGSLVRLPEPRRGLRDAATAEGEIVTVDRFGNAQTSLDGPLLERLALDPGCRVRVRAAAGAVLGEARLGTTFGDVPSGDPLAYLDSAGYVTLAVNGGSAAGRLGLAPGDVVLLDRAAP